MIDSSTSVSQSQLQSRSLKMVDSSSSVSQSSPLILKSIIENSIVAFPDDAHQHVLKYLLDAGLNENQALKFRQAWSKVVLGTQAFGRNSKSNGNPSLFSDELIRELSYSDDAIVKIINSCASAAKLNRQDSNGLPNPFQYTEDNSNPRDSVACLDAISRLGEDLSTLLTNLYVMSATTEDAHEERQMEVLEAIGLFRKSLRGTRIVWSGSNSAASGEYSPLDCVVHGYPELRKGRIDMQLRSERNDLNVYMSTDELVGMVISSKQSVHQERGWNAHLCLTELLSSKGLNIFPLPIGVQRDPTSLAATFAFEAASGALLLRSLQGPTLSTYLRRFPVVIHHWCAQLGAAYRALQTCSGSLIKPVRAARDVFVREDGLLLIGSVSFDSTPPGRKPHQSAAFLQVCCDVLQSSLCLSRVEHVHLQDDARTTAGSLFSDSDPEEVLDEAEAGGDVVFAVVAGSCLDLVVGGHQCSSVCITSPAPITNLVKNESSTYRNANRSSAPNDMSVGADAQRAASSVSALCVNVAVTAGSYTQYAAIEAAAKTSSSTLTVRISGLQPGVLSLHISTLVQDDGASVGLMGDAAGPRIRRRGARVKVVVVPAYSILSVPLQDLIGHLEECHQRSDPGILLNCQLFQRLHHVAQEPSEATSFAVKNEDVQKGWQDIKRVINNYGNMHNPK